MEHTRRKWRTSLRVKNFRSISALSSEGHRWMVISWGPWRCTSPHDTSTHNLKAAAWLQEELNSTARMRSMLLELQVVYQACLMSINWTLVPAACRECAGGYSGHHYQGYKRQRGTPGWSQCPQKGKTEERDNSLKSTRSAVSQAPKKYPTCLGSKFII